MYFQLHEMAEKELKPSIIKAKNIAEAKIFANEIGKKNGLHHVHFHKYNMGFGSLQGRTHSYTTHCVTVK